MSQFLNLLATDVHASIPINKNHQSKNKSNKLNRAKFVEGDHYNHCVTLLPRGLSRGHLLSSDVRNTATINERILWVIIIQRTKVPYA